MTRVSRHKFTLIELLIVVAVIAILISLLLPALQHAKGAAKKALCMSNQKQFILLVLSYANDYGGVIPQGVSADNQTPLWHEYFKQKPYTSLWDTTLRCPISWPEDTGFSGPNYGYLDGAPEGGFVGNQVDSNSRFKGVHAFKIRHPERFFLASDSVTTGPGVWVLPNRINPKPANTIGINGLKNRGGCIDFVWSGHVGNAANMLFIDGHVDSCDQGELKELNITKYFDVFGIRHQP